MTEPLAEVVMPTLIPASGVLTLLNTQTQILGTDPARLVLLVTTPTPASVNIMTLGHPDATGYKFIVTPGVQYEFSYQKHGDLVFQELWFNGGNPNAGVSWATLRRQ